MAMRERGWGVASLGSVRCSPTCFLLPTHTCGPRARGEPGHREAEAGRAEGSLELRSPGCQLSAQCPHPVPAVAPHTEGKVTPLRVHPCV